MTTATMQQIKRFAVFGTESTGKTSLAERLAAHFNEPWAPEFVREFWDMRGGKIVASDLGTIALGQEGDSVTIDAHRVLIQLNVPEDELARRRAAWVKPAPRYTRGVLAKFAKLTSSASKGAVTD